MKKGTKILFIFLSIIAIIIELVLGISTFSKKYSWDYKLSYPLSSIFFLPSVILLIILIIKDKNGEWTILKQIIALIPVISIVFALLFEKEYNEILASYISPYSPIILPFVTISILIIFIGPKIIRKIKNQS